MAYDVEKTMPKPTGGAFSKKTKRTIKSVNLMCYLQGNVTFNELYTQDFEKALEKIIPRAKLLKDPAHKLTSLSKGAYNSRFDITAPVVQALEDVAGIVNGKNVVLENLFRVIYSNPNSPEYQLTQRFRTLYNSTLNKSTDENELEHFCFPVIAFQEGNAPLLGKIGDPLAPFLRDFGNQTMYSLFVTQKSVLPDPLGILDSARKAHILIDATVKTIPKIGPLLFPASNGFKCNYATSRCVEDSVIECFCNDANGSCSAMSYP